MRARHRVLAGSFALTCLVAGAIAACSGSAEEPTLAPSASDAGSNGGSDGGSDSGSDGGPPATPCPKGFAHCASESSSTACETDLTKPATCGSCTNACPPDKPLCQSGTCQPDCGALANCNGTCVDLTNDAQHCGGCATTCTGPRDTCVGGQCACGAGTYCPTANVCADLMNSAEHCGACGKSCLGSTCSNGVCAPEKVSKATCAWSVFVSGGSVYWTENATGGCTGAIRSCGTSTPCTSLPPALATTSNYPMGVAAPGGASAIFYTDNQYPGYLRKMGLDGSGTVDWSGATASNSAALVSNGTNLFWGNGYGVYRTAIASAGATLVLSGNMSGAVANGPSSIAVDGTNFYAAPGGSTVKACPLGGDCSSSGGTLIATEPMIPSYTGVEGIASDGTSVFYTGGKHYGVGGSGDAERLVRCPVAGCPSGTPEVLWQTTTTTNQGESSHFGVVTDANNVYWGTIEGTIYYVAKSCTAPCTAKALVTGAKPFGMTIDGPYLYWADNRGGIYRVVRP